MSYRQAEIWQWDYSLSSKGKSYTDKVVECLKGHRSHMFQDGLVDPLQVIKLLGLHDQFVEYVAAGENNMPAADVATFWFEKLEQVYMWFDMERFRKHRPNLSMTDYGMLDEEQLPPNSVTHIQTFLKTQESFELTDIQLMIFSFGQNHVNKGADALIEEMDD